MAEHRGAEKPVEKPKLPAMTTADWIAWAERELERVKWLASAKEFAETLRDREKQLEKVTRALEAEQQELMAVQATIAERKATDAQAATQERAELQAMHARDQAAADKALAEAQAALTRVQAQIETARTVAERAEAQRDELVHDATRVGAEALKRRDALLAEEDAVRQRLSTALGRR